MGTELPAELETKAANFALESGLSHDEAVQTLISEGLRQFWMQRKKWAKGNPEKTIGAFSDVPGFAESVAEVIAGREERYTRAK